MIGTSRGGAPATGDGLGALAELIANPDAYRAKITELHDATLAHDTALKALHAKQAELAEAEAALGITRTDLESERRDIDTQKRALVGERALLNQAEALNKKLSADIDTRLGDLNAREHKLADDRQTLEGDRTTLRQRELAFEAEKKHRTDELDAREQRIAEAESYVQAKSRDLTRRLDALRAIVNAPEAKE